MLTPVTAAVIVLVATVGVAVVQLSAPQHAGAASQVTDGEVAQNGSFETGASPWHVGSNSNFVVYANGQISSSDTAYSGTHYAATNTSAPGGGFYEDVSLSISAGSTFCGSAEVRNQLSATGVSGTFVIWLLGGSHNDDAIANYSDLGNGTDWEQTSTCVTASVAQSDVRIQFYPTPNSGTLDVDAVDVHDALEVQAPVSQNGGFESGPAPWQVGSDSNFVVYANGQISPTDTAYAGTHYAATNTSGAGGGFYEDTTLSVNPGDTLCGSAEVRNQLDETGASGSFVIWLLGGSTLENGTADFSDLGNGTNWDQVSTCVTASGAFSEVRIQFYPTSNTSTLDVDAVNVQEDLDIQESVSQNGSFESGPVPWQVGNSSNFVVYANGQISPSDTAYAGTHYAATNTSAPGGGFYEDITGLTIAPGDTYCGSAEVRNQLNETGASGSFVIWLLGGSSNQSGVADFSNLGNGSNWDGIDACATASVEQTEVRIQFYPTPFSSTLDVDAVEAGNVSSAAPNPNCTPNDSCTPQTFADTLLSQPGINAPITASNEYALETWALAEGGGAGCPGQPPRQAPWANSAGPAGNPLNTTQPEPGSTNWNSVGVKIYSDNSGETCWYWGVLATTQTITGSIGNYGPIISALQNPVLDNYTQCVRVAEAVGNSEWGTGNFSADC